MSGTICAAASCATWGPLAGIAGGLGGAGAVYLIAVADLCFVFWRMRSRRAAGSGQLQPPIGRNFELTAEIPAPPNAIWPYLTDTGLVRRWCPDILGAEELTPGPAGVGSRSRVRMRQGRAVVELLTEITAWDPPRRLCAEVRSPGLGSCPMRTSYGLVSSAGDSTALTYAVRWEPPEFFLGLRAWLDEGNAPRRMERLLHQLRELVAADLGRAPEAGVKSDPR